MKKNRSIFYSINFLHFRKYFYGFITIFPVYLSAQVGINVNNPDRSAIIDITSTTKGLLPPRMTTASRDLIATPAKGLMLYNTTTKQLEVNIGSTTVPKWIAAKLTISGTAPIVVNSGTVSLADGGVSTIKLADAGVTTAKLGDGAVNSAKILDGTIATIDLADNATITSKITDANITTPKIADDAVNSVKILDNTVANIDLTGGTGGLYKGSGSLSGNTTVTQAANTLAFLPTVANGFSVNSTTLSIDGTKHSVGMGTSSPDPSAALDIFSGNKGLLIPRVALTGALDGTTIPSPATGLLVYNTNFAGTVPDNIAPGLAMNMGTPSSPKWSVFQPFNNSSGLRVDKLRYLGSADAAKTVVIDNFLEFRIQQAIVGPSNTYYLEMRLVAPPLANVVYRYTRIGYQSGANNAFATSFTFTPTDYGTFQRVDSPIIIAGNQLTFHGSFSTTSRNRLHELQLSLSWNEFVNMTINTY